MKESAKLTTEVWLVFSFVFNLYVFKKILQRNLAFVFNIQSDRIATMINTRRFILFLGDAIAIVGAFIAIIFVRSNIVDNAIPFTSFIGPLSSLLVLWLLVLFIFNFYDVEYIKPNPRNIGILAIACAINILLGGLVF